MKRRRNVGVLLIMILVVMQFIQPNKNRSGEMISADDISKVYAMPQDLHQMFIKKCYDCHSNNTKYPWYINIQPIGWWLAAHVHDGKEELNFSDFKNYPAKRAEHKLEEIAEVTQDRSMPLKAYTMFHEGTEITAEDEKAILSWLTSLNVKID
jgi:hypothetical protein